MKTNSSTQKVVTRFAPSPTGLLHLGNYRTALFSFLFARKNGGSFILRIEDTDRARSRKEYETNILDSLAWLSLSYDKLERQSERIDIHASYLKKMIDVGSAYISKEKSEDGIEKEIVRFKNPNKRVTFQDLIRGEISFDTTDLGDFVIAKNINEPLFHLAVVVDDHEMGVTHIVRGEDHISNTPRQILIQEAIGADRPTYAHLPLILAGDKSKLSKRKGAKSVTEYRDSGFLPQALINYLALLGWNPGTEQEIFSLDELVKFFDISQVNKSGAIFNEEKLTWFNKEHLKKISPEIIQKEVGKRMPLFENASDHVKNSVLPLIIEHISTYGDVDTIRDTGEFDFAFTEPKYAKEMLLWKKNPDETKTKERIGHIKNILSSLDEKLFTKEDIKNALWPYAETEGRGEVLWPMRVALSGREKSPDPFVISSIIGKDKTISRLSHAETLL